MTSSDESQPPQTTRPGLLVLAKSLFLLAGLVTISCVALLLGAIAAWSATALSAQMHVVVWIFWGIFCLVFLGGLWLVVNHFKKWTQ